MDNKTVREVFPRADRYDRAWAEANSLGENVLYMAESLAKILPMKPGMRILDLGCGHAISSIFFAKEYGAQVWAVDRGIDPTDNFARIKEQGCADRVFPLRADVRALPLPKGYFDAIVALDSYLYYGTDERLLPFLAPYLETGGHLGIVDAYLPMEFESVDDVPEPLRHAWREGDWYLVHSIDWWRRLWSKSGLVEVLVAEPVPGEDLIRDTFLDRYRDDPAEREVVAMMDGALGGKMGTFRMLARRTDRKPHLEDEDGEVPY